MVRSRTFTIDAGRGLPQPRECARGPGGSARCGGVDTFTDGRGGRELHRSSRNFAINTYTVTPSSIGQRRPSAPSTPQTVNSGAQPVFTLTPATGYHSLSVTGTCGGSLVGDTFTTAAVGANCTVIANFAINTYTVTPSSAGQRAPSAPSTPQTVNYDASGTSRCSRRFAGGGLPQPLGQPAADGVLDRRATPISHGGGGRDIARSSASFGIDTYTATPSSSGPHGQHHAASDAADGGLRRPA